MDNEAFLFSSLSEATKNEIFVVDDYAITIASCGKIEY